MASRRQYKLSTLRLEDYSDRELLLLVADVGADEDGGFVLPDTVARRLGISADNPVRSVISRFVWMTRYGAMERELRRDEQGAPLVTRSGRQKFGQRWRLTARGAMLAAGQLNASDVRRLEQFEDDQMILVTRWLGERQRTGEDLLGTLIRREYRFSTSPLRLLNGSRRG